MRLVAEVFQAHREEAQAEWQEDSCSDFWLGSGSKDGPFLTHLVICQMLRDGRRLSDRQHFCELLAI